MPTETTFPEIVFGRLSEYGLNAHRQLLSLANYRQYIYLFSGKGSAHFDGRDEALTPGTVISIPAQAVCELQFGKNADGVWFAVLEDFHTSRVLAAMPAMSKPYSPFWTMYYAVSIRREMTGTAQRALRKRVMNDLLSARDRLGLDSDPVVVGYMLLILMRPSHAEILNSAPDSTPPRMAAQELVLAFRRLIEKHYRQHWSGNDYCKNLGVTPRRLLNACQHVTGKFPKALVHERLMREAHANLIYSKKSISEIAYALGFESAAYFSHFYKRYAGVSPRQELQQLSTPTKNLSVNNVYV